MKFNFLFSLLILTFFIFDHGLVWAQAKPTKITARQQTLIEEAVKATDEQKYDAALELYQAALNIKELNIIYLGMGRLLQKQHKCQEAEILFDKSTKSNFVQTPSPSEINKIIQNYRQDHDTYCPTTIHIYCNTINMSLQLDNKKIECNKNIQLSPKTYTLIAQAQGFDPLQQEIQVTAYQTNNHSITLTPIQKALQGRLFVECNPSTLSLYLEDRIIACNQEIFIDPNDYVVSAEKEGFQKIKQNIKINSNQTSNIYIYLTPSSPNPAIHDFNIYPWIFLGVGISGFGIGSFAALQVNSINTDANNLAREDRIQDTDQARDLLQKADTYYLIEIFGFTLGGISTLTSLIWFILDEPNPNSTTQIQPLIIPNGAGVLWKFSP